MKYAFIEWIITANFSRSELLDRLQQLAIIPAEDIRHLERHLFDKMIDDCILINAVIKESLTN